MRDVLKRKNRGNSGGFSRPETGRRIDEDYLNRVRSGSRSGGSLIENK